jgi:hypothetical protein
MQPIATRILWNDSERVFHVTCGDQELLSLFMALARKHGVQANDDGSWTFPAMVSLGPEEFSEQARRRIEWGLSRDFHKDEPRPLVDQPKVVEQTSITGPERPRSFESAGPVVALTSKSLTDPSAIPSSSKPTMNSLKRLFGNRED